VTSATKTQLKVRTAELKDSLPRNENPLLRTLAISKAGKPDYKRTFEGN
jgi:hypothetical protein